MHPTERKALVAAYKERPVIAGVFAVICSATGRTWVGQSRHIDTQQNGLWFSLKTGGSPFASLQAEWKTHGADSFRFEQLDRLSPDLSDMARKDELKKRAALWMARLGAEAPMDDDLKRAKANERRRVRRLWMVAGLGGVGVTAGVFGLGMAKNSEGWMTVVGVMLAFVGLGVVIASFPLAGRFRPDGDTIRVENARGGYRDSVQKERAVSMAFMPFASLFLVYQGTISAWAIAGGQGEALNWMMVALSPMMSAVHLMMVTGFDIRGDKKMKRLLEDELTLSFRRLALNAALGVALAGMVVVFALGLWKPQAAVAAMPGLMFVTASAAGLRYWQLDRRAAGG